MPTSGYYRFPTIHDQTLVDDLWTVPVTGGIARRLTSNLGEVSSPVLSPDGLWLAFTGREEGHSEVYVMPSLGGPATRLTFLGSGASVVGWTPNGDEIVFASGHTSPFREASLYALAPFANRPGGECFLWPERRLGDRPSYHQYLLVEAVSRRLGRRSMDRSRR